MLLSIKLLCSIAAQKLSDFEVIVLANWGYQFRFESHYATVSLIFEKR
jgi:hypothetical protein